MSKNILVTFATRTGSTQGVAEAIGKTLAEKGISVEVKPMSAVNDLTPYSAVVAGSAIQASAWLPEAVDFVRVNQRELAQKPFATFMVCLTLALTNGEKYRPLTVDFIKPVRSMVKPVSEAQFAGVLDIKKIPSLSDRIKFGISVLFGVWKKGDHRDWNAINSWAASLNSIIK
jgi:menaquinone-dependent protoporphyrinogen oxidase